MTGLITKGTLTTLRDVSVIGTVYVYFTGWTYVHYYYCFFGLSLDVVEVPFYSVLAYAPNVLTQPVAIANKAVGLLMVATSLALVAWRPTTRTVVLGVLFCLAFPFLAGMSYTAAKEIVRERIARNRFPQITFAFKEPGIVSQELGACFLEANRNGRLRVVSQTTDRYYVFHRSPAGTHADDSHKFHIYEVLKRDFVLARLVPPALGETNP